MDSNCKTAVPPHSLEQPQEEVGILYYFGDPMCSWCWGFKPVLEKLGTEYPELRRINVMGGLRSGEERPMPDDLALTIQRAWTRIEDFTGQPFNHALWDKYRPLATTLPACRAVLAARLLDPQREWPFMVGLFKAYYTQAMNPSVKETYLYVADSVGLDTKAYEKTLSSEDVESALAEDLLTTKKFGITGFPTVVLQIKTSNYLIAPGYQPIEHMRRAINAVYDDAGVAYTRPESGLYS